MYENYYLDLEKVNKIEDSDEKTRINDYYRDMVASSGVGDKTMATSYFNTLYYNGYLKEIRDEKLKKLGIEE